MALQRPTTGSPILLGFVLLLAGLAAREVTVAAEIECPNVIFMLADDLGWSDSTPYGSTFYETPYSADDQGFDIVVGGRQHPGPPGEFFAPWPIDTIPAAPQSSHIDDVITTEVIRFVSRHRDF